MKLKEALRDLVIIIGIIFLFLPLLVLAYLEQIYMYLKGYTFNKGWGKYVKRKS